MRERVTYPTTIDWPFLYWPNISVSPPSISEEGYVDVFNPNWGGVLITDYEFDTGTDIPIFQVLTESDASLIDQLICDIVRKEGIWHGK